jgi:hypothetical protein
LRYRPGYSWPMSLIEDPTGKRPPYDLVVRSPLQGGPHPEFTRIDVSPREWLQVPVRIEGDVETADYRLTITTAVDDQLRPIVDTLTIQRKPDGAPINGDILARLGCGDVLTHMVERGTFQWVLDDERDVWTMIPPLEPLADAARLAFRRFRRPNDVIIEEQAREVSRLYREAREMGQRAPRRYVAERMHLSTRTVTRRLDYANQHGYLDDPKENDR